MHEHLSHTPDPVRQPRCQRRRPRLPALDGTRARHQLQLWQGEAQAGVGQPEVVAYMEERQLLAQSRFVFAPRVNPSPDRRHMLTKIQIQTLGKRGVDLPPPLGQDGLDDRCRAEDDAVFDPDDGSCT
jgi:hypothetical protein